MSKDTVVTINGQQYDSVTGMPVAAQPTTIRHKIAPSNSIHASLQRSKTLIRRVAKKPSLVSTHKKPGQTMDIARSNKIVRFAPHPVAPPAASVKEKDLPVRSHPLLTKANKLYASKKAPVTAVAAKTSREIKNDAIAAALAQPSVKQPRKHFVHRHSRKFTVAAIIIVVALLGGYLTYVNMPSLSVRVAAAEAGINATYPEFQPDGYSLDGPVTYSNGVVTINFAANTGTSKFSIQQAKSPLDSTAVLDNVVIPKAGTNYITNQEQGLTIYTYGSNAAWVNGGILYTITGNAPLSGDDIRQIATSM